MELLTYLKELQCALEQQGYRGSDNQQEDHSNELSDEL